MSKYLTSVRTKPMHMYEENRGTEHLT